MAWSRRPCERATEWSRAPPGVPDASDRTRGHTRADCFRRYQSQGQGSPAIERIVPEEVVAVAHSVDRPGAFAPPDTKSHRRSPERRGMPPYLPVHDTPVLAHGGGR